MCVCLLLQDLAQSCLRGGYWSVFITAVPITKLFAWWWGGKVEDMCVCVFITAVPSTKLFAWGGGILEDMCYERRRAEACVD